MSERNRIIFKASLEDITIKPPASLGSGWNIKFAAPLFPNFNRKSKANENFLLFKRTKVTRVITQGPVFLQVFITVPVRPPYATTHARDTSSHPSHAQQRTSVPDPAGDVGLIHARQRPMTQSNRRVRRHTRTHTHTHTHTYAITFFPTQIYSYS